MKITIFVGAERKSTAVSTLVTKRFISSNGNKLIILKSNMAEKAP